MVPISPLSLWFAAPAVQSALLIPLLLILLDLASGVAAALRLGSFTPANVAQFMATQVTPYVMTVVPALATALISGQGVAGAALTLHAFLVLFYWKQLHSIASNLLELCGLPESTVIGGVRALLKAAFPASLAATLPADGAADGAAADGAAGVPASLPFTGAVGVRSEATGGVASDAAPTA